MRYNFKYLLAFGYTRGYQGDYNDLVYLRSRFYSPETGRFQTRDTWQGDYNRPLSLNRWGYTEGNPVNLSDPTGEKPVPPGNHHYSSCSNMPMGWGMGNKPDYRGICFAEEYMDPVAGDAINTYVAAGFAVQSQFWNWFTDSHSSPWYWLRPLQAYTDSGLGPCQVSDGQMNTPKGKKIRKTYTTINTDIGAIIIPITNGEDAGGYGYGLEGQNQEDPNVAVDAMRMRISIVIGECAQCHPIDIFIVAGLAQNSDLFPWTLKQTINNKNYRTNFNDPRKPMIDWELWFKNEDKDAHARFELRLFTNDVKELKNRNWYVPDQIDFDLAYKYAEGGARK